MEQMSFSKNLILVVNNLFCIICSDKAVQHSSVMIIVSHDSQGKYALYDS